jgi:hypothetical protein
MTSCIKTVVKGFLMMLIIISNAICQAEEFFILESPSDEIDIRFVDNSQIIELTNTNTQNFRLVKNINFNRNGTLILTGNGTLQSSIKNAPNMGTIISQGNIIFNSTIDPDNPIQMIQIPDNQKLTLQQNFYAQLIALNGKNALLEIDSHKQDINFYADINTGVFAGNNIGELKTSGNLNTTFYGQIGDYNLNSDSEYDYIYTSPESSKEKNLDIINIQSSGKTIFKDNLYANSINIHTSSNAAFDSPVRTNTITLHDNSVTIFNKELTLFHRHSNVVTNLFSKFNGQINLSSADLYLNPEDFGSLSGKIKLVSRNALIGITNDWKFDENKLANLTYGQFYQPLNSLGIANDKTLIIEEGTPLQRNIVTAQNNTGKLEIQGADNIGDLERVIQTDIGSQRAKLSNIDLNKDGLKTIFTKNIFSKYLNLNSHNQSLVLLNNTGFDGAITTKYSNEGDVLFETRGILGKIGSPEKKIHLLKVSASDYTNQDKSLTGDIYSQKILLDNGNFTFNSNLLIKSDDINILNSVFNIGDKKLEIFDQDNLRILNAITVNLAYGPTHCGSLVMRNIKSIQPINEGTRAAIIINIDDNNLEPKSDSVAVDLQNTDIKNTDIIVTNSKWMYNPIIQKVVPKTDLLHIMPNHSGPIQEFIISSPLSSITGNNSISSFGLDGVESDSNNDTDTEILTLEPRTITIPIHNNIIHLERSAQLIPTQEIRNQQALIMQPITNTTQNQQMHSPIEQNQPQNPFTIAQQPAKPLNTAALHSLPNLQGKTQKNHFTHASDHGALQAKSISTIMLKRTYNFAYLDSFDEHTAPAAGDNVNDLNAWSSGFGGYKYDKNNVAHKDHFSGGAIGVEKNLNTQNILGLSITNMEASIKYSSGNKVFSINNIASFYGISKVNNFVFNTAFSLGQGNIKNTRQTNDNNFAIGKFKSYLYGIHGIAAYNFKTGNHLITPAVNIQYSYLAQNAYTEHSNSDQNQRIGKKNAQILTSTISNKYGYMINTDKWRIIPSIQLSITADLVNKSSNIRTKIASNGDFSTLKTNIKRQNTVSVSPILSFEKGAFSRQMIYN